MLFHPGALDRPLTVTRRIMLAAEIVNIWKHEPAEIGARWRGLTADHRARVMPGLGVSHASLIGAGYSRPLAAMRAYLDGLDAEGVPAERRCLAALGPMMLELARDRAAGPTPTSSRRSTRPRRASGWGPTRCWRRDRPSSLETSLGKVPFRGLCQWEGGIGPLWRWETLEIEVWCG